LYLVQEFIIGKTIRKELENQAYSEEGGLRVCGFRVVFSV
jgi:hypothetical protein